LQQLLPHRFPGELQQLGELRDRGGALRLQRDENRAAAIGQLVDGDDGEPSLGRESDSQLNRAFKTLDSKAVFVKSALVKTNNVTSDGIHFCPEDYAKRTRQCSVASRTNSSALMAPPAAGMTAPVQPAVYHMPRRSGWRREGCG
jgi:hypothetical protein